MKKLFEFMNTRFAPIANKISKNLVISSIQDAIMTILPLILVSSLITVVSLLNEIKGLPFKIELGKISDYSFGMISLGVAFLIAYNIMEKSKKNDKKLLTAVTAASMFLMFIGPKSESINDVSVYIFEKGRFGATGLVVAMLVGILVGLVMLFFSKFSFFKEESAMPDFIKVWFDSIIPIIILLGIGYVLNDILKIDIFTAILKAFSPLSAIVQTFWGFVLINFIQVFLYSFGISPWILTPITYPVYMQAIANNQALVDAGEKAIHIASNETVYSLIGLGGLGATLMLVILMAFVAKSARLKAIGRATLVPSLFNINEPVIFGAPVAFNPFLMIPMWLNGIVLSSLAYFVMNIGLVNIPHKPFLFWYAPYPLQSYLATGDWRALIVCCIFLLISLLIWFPFFKAYDMTEVKKEAEMENE